MSKLFSWHRGKREPGWLAVSLQPGALHFAHGVSEPGKKSTIRNCGTKALGDSSADFERVTKELGAERFQCLTLLPSTDYHLLLVDAPNVPVPELKAAVRWRLKDMLDYHVDDATIDVLDIPVPAGAAQRTHYMYTVAARNETIRATLDRFNAGGMPLTVIDIPDTAQRNVAVRLESEQRGVVALTFDAQGGLMTVSFNGELYLSRRLDVSALDLTDARGAARARMFD